jgi:hypothetical protein
LFQLPSFNGTNVVINPDSIVINLFPLQYLPVELQAPLALATHHPVEKNAVSGLAIGLAVLTKVLQNQLVQYVNPNNKTNISRNRYFFIDIVIENKFKLVGFEIFVVK